MLHAALQVYMTAQAAIIWIQAVSLIILLLAAGMPAGALSSQDFVAEIMGFQQIQTGKYGLSAMTVMVLQMQRATQTLIEIAALENQTVLIGQEHAEIQDHVMILEQTIKATA